MHGAHGPDLGEVLSLWATVPFAGMLLSIALFPLFAPKFWHSHFGKISVFWSLVVSVPFLLLYRGSALYEFLHIVLADPTLMKGSSHVN
jgi:Na+/H+ antiporter NhaD/arsenite permease-like protein